MKKYAFFIFLLTFIILSLASIFANGEEATFIIEKIALKYQGESSYREYDTTDAQWTLDGEDPDAAYGPYSVTILTDEANDLPSGVITEIKFYILNEGDRYWLKSNFAGGTVEEANNFLGSSIDLSTIKRKKVTCKFYAEEGAGLVTTTPAEENL